MIGQQLRHRKLGQNLIGLNAQGVIRAGKAVGELLIAGRSQDRFGSIGLRELLGRNLRQPAGLLDFQSHGSLVNDPEVTCEARRAVRQQSERVR